MDPKNSAAKKELEVVKNFWRQVRLTFFFPSILFHFFFTFKLFLFNPIFNCLSDGLYLTLTSLNIFQSNEI